MQAYERLETAFAQWAGVENVVGCSSGTAALHLALEALQLPPGSEVILPDYTMVACARAVTLAGLTPIFVDVDAKTLLIDPLKVEEVLEQHPAPRYQKQRVIMAVHVYGRRCNMEALSELADKYDLFLIEDLAEAHGVEPHPGTDAACWSFYKNKIIHGEEGGAVAFRDPKAAKMARSLRTLGFTEAHDYTHIPRGHNYRLSNAHAELILASLHNATSELRRRQEMCAYLDRWCLPEWKQPAREVCWVYDLRIPNLDYSKQRGLVEYLRASGIPARYGFKPMTFLEEYVPERNNSKTPHSYDASREVIYLQLDPFLPPRAPTLMKEWLEAL